MLNSKVDNYIIVTHGNTMRVLKMFLLDMKVESYKQMEVPENAGGFHMGYDKTTKRYCYFGEF